MKCEANSQIDVQFLALAGRLASDVGLLRFLKTNSCERSRFAESLFHLEA